MKLDVMFVGDSFSYNAPLQEYVLRDIQKHCDTVDSISFFKKSDNTLFLFLEEHLQKSNQLLLITSKNTFSTVGKVLSTIIQDNQIVRDGMLVPSKAQCVEPQSYLLEYQHATINVLQVDEGKKMPRLLLQSNKKHKTVHIFDEEEEVLSRILKPIAQTYEVHFTMTAIVTGWLRVDIVSNKYGEINNFIGAAKKLLSNKLIASENIFAFIIETLAKNNKTLTFAESCTGGLLSYLFTQNNGASMILEGALVTYSNTLKENWIAVSNEILRQHGAVSAEVVAEMSEGALGVSGADYSIAISGIAGDSGGSEEKPVGTVYIGVRMKDKHFEERCFFQGDRNYIQQQSALYGVKMMILMDKETFF